MILVKILQSPIKTIQGTFRTYNKECVAFQPLHTYLPTGYTWHRIVINGGVYTDNLDYIVPESSEIFAIPEIRAEPLSVGKVILISLLISAAFTGLALLLTPRQKFSNIEDDPSFNATGIRTAQGPGNVRPFGYGTRRVGGQLLSHAVEQAQGLLVQSPIVYETGEDGAYKLRDNAARTNLAQGFQTPIRTNFASMYFKLQRVGTPSGNIFFDIQTDSGGVPSGEAVVRSYAKNVTDISTTSSWVQFTFLNDFWATENTQYHLVLHGTYGISASNYIQWAADTTAGSYANGAVATYNGSSWTTVSDDDFLFRLIKFTKATDGVSTTNDPNIIQVVGLSEGANEEIQLETLELNDQPIQNFDALWDRESSTVKNPAILSRVGLSNQTIMTGFEKSQNTFNDGREIVTGSIIYTTTTDVDSIVLNVDFNEGLFRIHDEREFASNRVLLSYRYRVNPAGSWSAFVQVEIIAKTRRLLHRPITVDNLAFDTYDIELRLDLVDNDDPEKDAWKPFLTSVTEIINDTNAYNDIAAVGLRTFSQENIQNGVINETVIGKWRQVRVNKFKDFDVTNATNASPIVVTTNSAHGYNNGDIVRIKDVQGNLATNGTWNISAVTSTTFTLAGSTGNGTYVSSTGKCFIEEWTDNPSWCIMDVLTHERYGLGIPDAEIDLTSFNTYASFADESVSIDGGSEKRLKFDYYLDRAVSGQDALNEMLAGQRAVLIKSEGAWKIRPLRDETPVALVSWSNIKQDSLRISYVRDIDKINVLEGRFLNEDINYEQDIIQWPDNTDLPAQIRKDNVEFRSITRSTQVIRELQHELNKRQLQKQTLEFEMGLEGVLFEATDVIRFSHPLPGFGTSGRLLSVDGSNPTTVLHLDEDVSFISGNSYHCYIRHNDDSIELKTVVNPGTTTTKTITLTGALSQSPTAGTTLWAFGEVSPDTAQQLYRITSIERTGDFVVRVSAVEHNAAIYTDPVATPVQTITTLFNPAALPPPLTLLIASEDRNIQQGSANPSIRLEWDVQAPLLLTNSFSPYYGVNIYKRYISTYAVAGSGELGVLEFGEAVTPQGVITSYTTGDDTNYVLRNLSGSQERLAQSFQFFPQQELIYIELLLKKVGSPTGNIWVTIESDSSGPSGTAFVQSINVDVSTISTTQEYVRFVLKNPTNLLGFTSYHIVLQGDYTASDSNHIVWRGDASSPTYDGGQAYTYNGSVWSGASGTDLLFQILKINAANYDLLATVFGPSAFTYIDRDILPGQSIQYKVAPISKFFKENIAGTKSVVITPMGAGDVLKPASPSNLRLVNQGTISTEFIGPDAQFTWDAVTLNNIPDVFISGYRIEVWNTTHNVRVFGPIITDTTQFTYTHKQNLEDHATIQIANASRNLKIRVWTKASNGEFSLTPTDFSVTNPAPDMSAITPTTTALFQAGIVDWTQFAEPSDFDKYVVYLGTTTPPTTEFQSVGIRLEKIFPQGLIAGTTYYVQIVPYDTFGIGTASQIASFIPLSINIGDLDTTPPATPTGLSLTTGTTIGDDGTIIPFVRATWNANVESDFDRYQVNYRFGLSSTPTAVLTTETSLELHGIPGNVSVFVKIKAIDTFGNASAFTSEETATTGTDTTAPIAPTNITVFGKFQHTLLLWTPPADLDYAYSEIHASQTNDVGTASKIGQGNFSFIHDDLANGVTWYYWLKPVDFSNNIGAFAPVTSTTPYTATTSLVDNADINTVSASKVIAGTIEALVKIGVDNIQIDGVNDFIIINDSQGAPVTRVKLGKLGGGANDWGIQIFNAAGTLMFDATGDGVTAAGIKAAVIDSTHLRTDTAVITVAAQIQNAIIGDAQIDRASANKLVVQTADIGDAQILSAKIGNLEVGTIKIANNAVTSNIQTKVDAEESVTDVEEVLTSITIPEASVLDDGTVVLLFKSRLQLDNFDDTQIHIREDSITGTIIDSVFYELTDSDAPTTGRINIPVFLMATFDISSLTAAKTFVVSAVAGTSQTILFTRSIFLSIQLKK